MSTNLILWIILALSVIVQIASAAYTGANTQMVKELLAAKRALPPGTQAVVSIAIIAGLGMTASWGVVRDHRA